MRVTSPVTLSNENAPSRFRPSSNPAAPADAAVRPAQSASRAVLHAADPCPSDREAS
jgi:hypothetical protein